jgi:hypothetical protein
VVKSPLARNELQQKMSDTQTPEEPELEEAVADQSAQDADESGEYGGPRGMEPTRYGDWEKNGRCIDF